MRPFSNNPRKVIRDYRFRPSEALELRDAVVEAEGEAQRHGPGNVIPPYYPRRPIPAGDPFSPSGTQVELSELADDVVGAGSTLRVREVDGSPDVDSVDTITVPDGTLTDVGGGEVGLDFNAFELREVILGPFTALVAPGTAINIQTGVYAGAGSPVSLDGDLNVTLPGTGAAFKDDGRIEVHLNGQELTKGDGAGNGEAEWVSTTQIKVNIKIKVGGTVLVRAPFPTA